ncbi:MAG: IS256 family transposase [Sporichthyaceae bacterium]
MTSTGAARNVSGEAVSALSVRAAGADAEGRSRERVLAEQIADGEFLDELIGAAQDGTLALTGPGGFIPELIKRVLEAGLAVELSDHLGYEAGDPVGRGSGNSRNGHTPKTVLSETGPVALEVPRDRNGSFSPALVPKGERRLAGGLDEMIVSLYAGGMTVRDIEAHLARTLGVEISRDTISKITDAVLEEVKAWQNRPLDPIYPIVYIDALVVKVRDGGHVVNKAAHIVLGVDTDGVKHVLGIWVQTSEGAKFWLHVLTELANRGVKDVLIACCDGLEGLPEAIETVWPRTVVQTCVVHLIRASMRYVSYGDRKAAAKLLRGVYTAANEDAALDALGAFADSDLGRKYPAAAATWERAWDRFTPFLAFPPEVRKIIYTTNSIESLNYQLRKIIKNRGHFPNDDAVVKLLWLAIRDIEDKRARARAKETGLPKKQRKAPGKLVEGGAVLGWNQALNALAIAYPGRLPEAIQY